MPLAVEVRAARHEGNACSYDFNLFFADARNDVTESVFMTAGFHNYIGASKEQDFSLGAGCSFQNGLSLEGVVIATGDGDAASGPTLSESFGAGRVFDCRDWNNLLHGD